VRALCDPCGSHCAHGHCWQLPSLHQLRQSSRSPQRCQKAAFRCSAASPERDGMRRDELGWNEINGLGFNEYAPHSVARLAGTRELQMR
jgi:hypothetical protein